MATSPYDFWRAALRGERLPRDRGAQAGFYRYKHEDGTWEPVAFWLVKDPKDETKQFMRWQRNYGKRAEVPWDKVFPDQVDDLWARCSHYPIPEAVYKAVRAGQPWPPEWTVPLTLEDAQRGVIATEEFGRKRLAEKAPVEEVRGMGDNSGKAGVPPLEQYRDMLRDKIRDYNKWLESVGGKLNTQTLVDQANAFKEGFRALRIEADKQREVEKKPHLDAGRKVDADWQPIKKKADEVFAAIVDHQRPFLEAEAARIRKEREEAAAAARNAPLPPSATTVTSGPLAKAGGAGRSTAVKQEPVVIIVDHDAVCEAYMKTGQFRADAVAWAERTALTADPPIPGTKIEYHDVVKG